MSLHRSVLLSAFAVAVASTAAAQELPRVVVLAGGGATLQEQEFAVQRTIHEFAEDGAVDSSYTTETKPGLELGLQVRFAGRLGVIGMLEIGERDTTGTYEASLPHPLYLDRHRTASGELAGTYTETALHLGLAWLGHAGPLDLRVFAGPSWFPTVEADVLNTVSYDHAYPFDEIRVRTLQTGTRSGSGFGFHVGAGADWPIGRRFGVGVQGRFSRATVDVGDEADGDDGFEVDAGGLSVSAGLRLRF